MSKKRITRKEARERVEQVHLSGALAKVIRRFFPGLIKRLKEVSDPRHQSYITYENYVLLMTRILSAVFYISSMRKSRNCKYWRDSWKEIGRNPILGNN